MKLHTMEQGSEEWLKIRCGKVTASHFSDVMSKGQGRKTYMLKLAAERATGVVQPSFKNEAMQWGNDQEPFARACYEQVTGNKVEQVGFVEHSDYVGVSPDGLVGSDGLVEIKCPNPSTHIGYIESGKLPAKYKAQVQGQMWACDRAWCDFVSYDPRNGDNGYFCVRVERDRKYIGELVAALDKFVDELKEIVKTNGTASEIRVMPDWDKISLGICRTVILCAEIQKNGMDSILGNTAAEMNSRLSRIEKLADFCMNGLDND